MESWVRYEGQVKQRQQRELADAVIAKIEKDLEDPKVLRQILDQSVKDVERKFLKNASLTPFLINTKASSPRSHESSAVQCLK